MKRLTILLLLSALVFSCKKDQLPVIEWINAEPDSVYPGDTVVLSFHANPGNDHDLYMHFEWYANEGVLYNPTYPTGSTFHWIAPKRPGPHYITLTVTDPKYSVKDSILVTVLDTMGTFTDARDGHEYKWIKIGKQIWMAENLAYLPEIGPPWKESSTEPFYYVFQYFGTSVSEAELTDYYHDQGVIYNHPAASVSCPSSWHLPSDKEWQEMEKYLGMSESAADSLYWRYGGEVGKKLKSIFGWDQSIPSDNSSGFNAIPSVYKNPTGHFVSGGSSTHFWTSTIVDQDFATYRRLDGNTDGIARLGIVLSVGYSVRCVMDN
jgi:uncharacterized protein (TIGR02145 family)